MYLFLYVVLDLAQQSSISSDFIDLLLSIVAYQFITDYCY